MDRVDLQYKLENMLGNRNVYFQPPASVKLEYPCIIYNIGNGDTKRANCKIYKYTYSYEITIIYKKPNMDIIKTMLDEFEMCRFDRSYISDNLIHYSFNLYY